MPKDNIERAIAKGTGEGGEADAIETVLYEGYGPGGVAVLVEALTDNRNRTGADVRHLLTKNGGSLGEPGSVSYLFDKRGVVLVDGARYGEDDLLVAVEAGAEDIVADDEALEVVTAPGDLAAVRAAIEQAGIEIESAEVVQRPSTIMCSVDSAQPSGRLPAAGAHTRAPRQRPLSAGVRAAALEAVLHGSAGVERRERVLLGGVDSQGLRAPRAHVARERSERSHL